MGKLKNRHRTKAERCKAFQTEMKGKIEEFNIFVKHCFPPANLEDYKSITLEASSEVYAIRQLVTLLKAYTKDVLVAGVEYLQEVFVDEIIKVIQNHPESEKTKEIPKLMDELRIGHKEMQFYTEFEAYIEMLLQWYHKNLKSL